jgi:hypothetical protein
MLRRGLVALKRDFLTVLALFVVVLVESQMNTGVWRFIWPALAVGLFSPFAQKVWAGILVGWALFFSAISSAPPDWVMPLGFLVVRAVFVWIMLIQGRLWAAHRVALVVGRMCKPCAGAAKKLLVAGAVGVILSVIFFSVPRPYLLVGLAVFIVYLTTRIPSPPPRVRTRTRTGPAEIALTIVCVVVCALLLELAVRRLLPDTNARLWKFHPRSLITLAENAHVVCETEEFSCSYRISDQGLRDRHYDEKDASTYRILCVGDSFTMGDGVSPDETYVKVLERLLAEENLDKRVEVINAGTGNYGVWQELIVLEEKGPALEPDLVILQTHPATDVHNALGRVDRVLRSYEPWYPIDLAWARGRHRIITHLAMKSRRWSRAIPYIHARFASPRSPLIPHLRPHFRAWMPSFPPSEDDRPWWLETDLRTYYPELEEGWGLMEGSIRQMASLCRRNGIEFLVFAVPRKADVYPKAFERLMAQYRLAPDMYDPPKDARLIREICERNGIEFADILPRFIQECEEGKRLYYVRDGHWTPRGHGLCARILYEHLMETNLQELSEAQA